MKRFPPSAGIAIGPILFIIAILGILAAVIAADSGGGFSQAGVSDRVAANIVSQANMIRAKIIECQMQYLTNGTASHVNDCGSDSYPCSDQTNGTAVSALTCPNDPLTAGGEEPSLWTGLRVSQLPVPTQGFGAWTYFNGGDSGGRCFWAQPTKADPGTAVIRGLERAAAKFTNSEVTYDSSTHAQRFIVWVTLPADSGSTSDACKNVP